MACLHLQGVFSDLCPYPQFNLCFSFLGPLFSQRLVLKMGGVFLDGLPQAGREALKVDHGDGDDGGCCGHAEEDPQ